jgi:hypothetical protein
MERAFDLLFLVGVRWKKAEKPAINYFRLGQPMSYLAVQTGRMNETKHSCGSGRRVSPRAVFIGRFPRFGCGRNTSSGTPIKGAIAFLKKKFNLQLTKTSCSLMMTGPTHESTISKTGFAN